MTIRECRDRLKENIISTLNIEDISPADIGDDMSLFGEEGLALDSLDAVELVVMLEKEFGIVIEDSAVARQVFASVATLADYVLAQQRTTQQGTEQA